MDSEKIYAYIKEAFRKNGIDFNSIPREEILSICQNYNGDISKNNYSMVVEVINASYESV